MGKRTKFTVQDRSFLLYSPVRLFKYLTFEWDIPAWMFSIPSMPDESTTLVQPQSLAAGLARNLGDNLLAIGEPIHLEYKDVDCGIQIHLEEHFTWIEEVAAYGGKQIEKERMSHPYLHFEEAVEQVKHDVERMKSELDAGLERVLDFRDKIPRGMRDMEG